MSLVARTVFRACDACSNGAKINNRASTHPIEITIGNLVTLFGAYLPREQFTDVNALSYNGIGRVRGESKVRPKATATLTGMPDHFPGCVTNLKLDKNSETKFTFADMKGKVSETTYPVVTWS